MADACSPHASAVEAAFRGAEGAVAAGVLGFAALAVRARGCGALWSDRGSAYVQLLIITGAISLLQLLHALLDISWLVAVHGEANARAAGGGPVGLTGPWGAVSNSTYYIQRVDASMNMTCLSLLLVAFLVITFFFLRMAIRFRIANPDQVQLQEAQAALKFPLIISVSWTGIMWLSALSGLQPDAFTCEDPLWEALLLTFVLVGIALLTGVCIILYERHRRRRGNKFWNSLLSLAAVLVLATGLAILELLDHVLRGPADCRPLDDVVGACVDDGGVLSPGVRGLLHLLARCLIYSLPSIALLSLFRSHRRQDSRRGAATGAAASLRGAEHLPLPSLSRPWRQGRGLASMTESLLRAPPSISSLSEGGQARALSSSPRSQQHDDWPRSPERQEEHRPGGLESAPSPGQDLARGEARGAQGER